MIIETQRCRIRSFENKDINAFMSYRNNDGWMKYQSFKNRTREEYADFLLGENTLRDGMKLAIAEKANDGLIGDIYLKLEDGAFWLGYSIDPARARKGYIFEAVGALIQWLSKDSPAAIYAGVLRDNVPSKRLLEKLGFVFLRYDEDGQEEVYIHKTGGED